MATRKMGVILLLICFCFCFMPQSIHAASSYEVTEPVLTDEHCSLIINYRCSETSFSGQTVGLYKIADVSDEYQFTLVTPFVESNLILNGIQTNGEWNVIRSTLEAYILSNHLTPDYTVATDELGQANFAGLTPGLYFATAVTVALGDETCVFDSALVTLPGLGEGGERQYQVAVSAKPEILPPVNPDEEIQLKVVKLWKGDEENNYRPQSVEVEIFRDGVSVEIVTLSDDNNWSHNWTAKDDGAVWNVVERNVPAGYMMTVEQRETAFVVINSWIPEGPDNPPETGDTTDLLLPTVLMYLSGTALILLGIVGKRKRHEETK